MTAGGLAGKAIGGLTRSLVRRSSASSAASPRKAGRPPSLAWRLRRGRTAAPLTRRSQPSEQDAWGEWRAAGVLCFWRYYFLLSPCCIEGVCRCRSSELLESVLGYFSLWFALCRLCKHNLSWWNHVKLLQVMQHVNWCIRESTNRASVVQSS
jgi:hypothetical protein